MEGILNCSWNSNNAKENLGNMLENTPLSAVDAKYKAYSVSGSSDILFTKMGNNSTKKL